MRTFLHALAAVGLLTAAVLTVLGIAAWPPGGLTFAVPYVFWGVAAVVGVPSGLLFLLTRTRPGRSRDGA